MQPTPVSDKSADFPVARIDSLEPTFAQPFREFLEGYGLRVYVNQTPPVVPDYHLVAGDPEFVKSFFATKTMINAKRLVMIYNGTNADTDWIFRQTRAKAILIDPRVPSSRVVNDIFGFFFTGKDKLLDLRSRKVEEISETPDLVSEKNDRQRIQESLDTIFKKVEVSEKENQPGQPPVVRSRREHHHLSKLVYFFLVFLGLVVVPLVWYGASILAALVTLYFAGTQIYSGNINVGQQAGGLAQNWLRQSNTALNVLSTPFRLTGTVEIVRGQERLLSLLDDVAGSLVGMGKVMDKGQEVGRLLLTQAGSNASPQPPAIAVGQLQSQLLAVENKLSLAELELGALSREQSFPFWFPTTKSLARRASLSLASLQRTLNYLNNFLALYPTLAGFRDKKTYLVLFQNSMELRPTGGFIGSLASATFDQGRLADLATQDVYSLDGQLKGHVDPPRPIRELLNEEHWYLRDSNWDPDFSKSSKRAAWFYEKETGKTVDGVFAISSPFLVDLLRTTGPLELPDYNDRITAENFFGKSLHYTQNDFFPGSTQKKDFLGSLVNALVLKLTGDPKVASPRLFTAVAQALERGDILLNFTDPQEQAVVEQFGWAGRGPQPSECLAEEKSTCLPDSLAVVEANLGVNKVNYYVIRQEQNLVSFAEDGSLKTSTAVVYRNTSSADHPSAGAGTYKVYARFYLPLDAILDSGILDATNLPRRDSTKPAPTLPYFEEDNSTPGVRVIGVAFLVPPTSERRLVIAYHREARLQFGKNGAVYDFRLARQPGLSPARETRIVFPIFWTARQMVGEGSLTLLAKQGQLEYNTVVSRDQEIKINFTK